MFLEALGSALVGLALAWAAVYRLPHRLPARTLVLPTGVAGALFGAFLTHTALGSTHVLVLLSGGAIVAAASLSLLLRPTERFRRSSAPA
ncbi:hypothetical protein [Streptomyces heilongjiangensis]|uniref:Integral membrane protein n=1 Tax=Streptomyces heilongjiangensis TaxID=945052 RepID=A0ABW1B0B7_9ACTN|nr:hypothetical protein [Streptomyces heilongjiangensis]MDC2945542.1 hypothetical protein [Streptomyces heilongjiangensis]